MVFCNPLPIAMSCYLGTQVVKSAHKAFFKAVCDLTQLGKTILKLIYVLGHNLTIDFMFIQLRVRNKNLSYKYCPGFCSNLNRTTYEYQVNFSTSKTEIFS